MRGSNASGLGKSAEQPAMRTLQSTTLVRTHGAERMITTEELARIRAAAVGDMLGDSKALDEMGPAATVFRLCRELERLDREADVLSIWLANAYIDIDLMPDIDSGAMNPPLPEDVREAAREAVGEGEESCPKN